MAIFKCHYLGRWWGPETSSRRISEIESEYEFSCFQRYFRCRFEYCGVLVVSTNLSPSQSLRRTSSARSNNGSNTDLRTLGNLSCSLTHRRCFEFRASVVCLDVITTQTNFRPFKKFEPSPRLERKQCGLLLSIRPIMCFEHLNFELKMLILDDSPILPAYGRVSNGAAAEVSIFYYVVVARLVVSICVFWILFVLCSEVQ